MTDAEIVSLRDYIDSKFHAMEKAVDVAQKANEYRLESMNNFRDQLREQASNMVTRAEFRATTVTTEKDISFLRESRAELAGKASMNAVYAAFMMTAISLLIALVALIRGFMT